MRDVVMALPSPFGFSMAHSGPAFCPTIKSIYPNLGGYRLLQDQARPEYAVLYAEGRIATVTLEPVKDLPQVSYMHDFKTSFELMWVKSVPVPDSILSQTSMLSGAGNRANFMMKVGTNDLDVCTRVFDEQVGAQSGVLLRLHTNISKVAFDGINVEIIAGDTIAPIEGKRAKDFYIVSTASDEIIGSIIARSERTDYYSVDVVTADVQLAAAFLAACAHPR